MLPVRARGRFRRAPTRCSKRHRTLPAFSVSPPQQLVAHAYAYPMRCEIRSRMFMSWSASSLRWSNQTIYLSGKAVALRESWYAPMRAYAHYLPLPLPTGSTTTTNPPNWSRIRRFRPSGVHQEFRIAECSMTSLLGPLRRDCRPRSSWFAPRFFPRANHPYSNNPTMHIGNGEDRDKTTMVHCFTGHRRT